VAEDVGRFAGRFDQHDPVARRIESGELRAGRIELVAKHQPQPRPAPAAFHAGSPPARPARPARQRCEQWRTSGQFFAHFLRQTMTRPHPAQVLLGRYDLLPRAAIGGGVGA
jgi:hypothetical protein